MAELADALDLGSSGATRPGSTPGSRNSYPEKVYVYTWDVVAVAQFAEMRTELGTIWVQIGYNARALDLDLGTQHGTSDPL